MLFVLTEAEVDRDVRDTHELFATRALEFLWYPKGTYSPALMLSATCIETTAYFRLTPAFLAWVRGCCKARFDAGVKLTRTEQRAVDRIWSYVCSRYEIDEDHRERLPEPSEQFPESDPIS